MSTNDPRKVLLDENRLPRTWYNVVPDLGRPPDPVLHPATRQPVTANDLLPLFPLELIKQGGSQERFIAIPEPVLDLYRLWRPTPLMRAKRLERHLDTPARIYFKHEGLSPVGSHKGNTALPQVYFAKQEGVKKIATETGAGQWGSALAMAGAFFGVEVEVFMVKVSYEQKPFRRSLMQAYGATVHASPTQLTSAGRGILQQDPNSPGSLGIAISEAVEVAATSGGKVKYALGSVLNHVLLHQTIIGEEAILQLQMAGDFPDIVVGCVGGGSNFAGLAFPLLREAQAAGRATRFIAVEPLSCPSLTRGKYEYDFGDTVGSAPMVKMYTLGHQFMPPSIHAGGLRYHGMSPLISQLYHDKVIEARACPQLAVFEAALTFTRCEGIVPAPESAHAIRVAIDEALAAREAGQRRVIVFNLSGHGHFDMAAFDDYLSGKLSPEVPAP
jgi:tryptophan synthase beta chain